MKEEDLLEKLDVTKSAMEQHTKTAMALGIAILSMEFYTESYSEVIREFTGLGNRIRFSYLVVASSDINFTEKGLNIIATTDDEGITTYSIYFVPSVALTAVSNLASFLRYLTECAVSIVYTETKKVNDPDEIPTEVARKLGTEISAAVVDKRESMKQSTVLPPVDSKYVM